MLQKMLLISGFFLMISYTSAAIINADDEGSLGIFMRLLQQQDRSRTGVIPNIEDTEDKALAVFHGLPLRSRRSVREGCAETFQRGRQCCNIYDGRYKSSIFREVTCDTRLSDIGYSERISSVSCYGIWLFHTKEDFGKHRGGPFRWGSRGKTFIEVQPRFSFGRIQGDYNNAFKSMRYIGPTYNPFETDSITAFEHPEFLGEKRFTTSGHYVIGRDFNNKASCFIITGSSNWRIYDDQSFEGDSICLYASSSGVAIITRDEVGSMNDKMSSARKGC